MMAKAVPTTSIHHGSSGGRERPISTAVSAALPSIRAGLMARPRSLSTSASHSSAVTNASRIWIKEPQPKNQVWASKPGTQARITSSIRVRVCLRLWANGAVAILNMSLSITLWLFGRLTGHLQRRSRRLWLPRPPASSPWRGPPRLQWPLFSDQPGHQPQGRTLQARQ